MKQRKEGGQSFDLKRPEGSLQGRKRNDRLANQALIKQVQLHSFHQQRKNFRSTACTHFSFKTRLKISFVKIIFYAF